MIARMVGGRSENVLYRVTTICGSFSNTCKARGIYLSDSWNANLQGIHASFDILAPVHTFFMLSYVKTQVWNYRTGVCER